MIEVIIGSIFDSKDKYICHQTNCTSNYAAALAKDMFELYPYSNVYSGRKEPDQPGTIKVMGDGLKKRFVVNIFGQYYPGGPSNNSKNDDKIAREKYFYQALNQLSKLNLESIAFPAGIGCGIASGDWNYYYGTIKNFAAYIHKKQNAVTKIYKLAGANFDT